MRSMWLALGFCFAPLAASAQAAPNLAVEALTVTGLGAAGGRLPVQFDVVVSGGLRTPFAWAAYLSTTGALEGARAVGTYGPATPAGDGRMRVVGDVTLPADVGGSYFLVIQLDPAGLVADQHPFDDAIASDARIRIAPRVADVQADGARPLVVRGRVGDPVRVAVDVENAGSVRADVVLVATLDRDGTPSTSDAALAQGSVSLDPGARRTVELVGVVPAGLQPGRHQLAVMADPGALIAEVDESNNVVVAASPFTVFEDRLELVTASIPNGTVFQRYFARFSASGGDGLYQYTVTRGRLPAGLQLGLASGDITGSPLSSGAYELTVEVRSDVLIVEKMFTMTVAESGVELTIVTPELPGGTLGLPYAAELAAAGGEPPYRWTLLSGTAAPGLDLGTDGRIAGVPTQEGSFSFAAEVSDALGGRVRTSFVMHIAPANVLITSLAPAAVSVGEPAVIALEVRGGASPYEWTALSTPPPGLTLGEDGVFTGTPSRVGRFATRVQVTDGTERAHSDTALVMIEVVDAGEFQLVVPEVKRLLLREPLSVTLRVEGGRPPYSWRVDPRDEIPPGFTLTPAALGEGEAVLSGSSIRGIDRAFLVEVSDRTGRVRSEIVAIHVDAAVSTASDGCTCVAPRTGPGGGVAALLVLGAGLAWVRRRRV